MKRRPGCLAPQGLIAAALTLVLLAVVILIWGGVPFAPGPLNAQAGAQELGGVRSHAEVGGLCSACHTAPWGSETMSDRCLACHEAIRRQLEDPESLHGALASSGSALPCYACHGEHQGPDASLTRVDIETFPHQATGFSLEGHGQRADGSEFGCADCHGQDLARFDPPLCARCHSELDAGFMEMHTGHFGDGCLACHDGVDRYGARFDHDEAAFPLRGGHAGVDCRACHPGARSPADLRSAPQDCGGCHDEPAYHGGLLGTGCAACHSTAAWTPATYDRAHLFPIDHGEEGTSPCRTCHPDRLDAYTCYGCHEHDPAEIADEHRDEGVTDIEECAACHPTGLEDEAEDRR